MITDSKEQLMQKVVSPDTVLELVEDPTLKENECIISINTKNDYSERDDNDNWTQNKMQLTFWEKGQRTQIQTVEQMRTISYWDE